MNWLLILPPIWAWLVLEFVLTIRDVIRRKGRAAADRGTRFVVTLGFFAAWAGAILTVFALRNQPAWMMGNWHFVTGEIVAWVGLAIRLWSIIVLGRSFRLTVEVDTDQKVVDSGPYRLVRHPSYTGLLVLAIGFGIALGNWLSLVILLLVPLLVLMRRIWVEENQLIAVLGQPYVDYRKRRKRLVPGIW